MKKLSKISIAIMAIAGAVLIADAFDQGVSATDKTFSDAKTAVYAERASAVIYAPSLTRGSLFRLRGSAGRASFTRKGADGSWCDASPMRLLLGDFGGTSTGVSGTGPVLLFVMSPTVAAKLAQGSDVVDEDLNLLDIDQPYPDALQSVDIVVAGAASANSSLVLNPGRNILSDLFGASTSDGTCRHRSAEIALMELQTGD